ncbi:MAG: endonuclease/exonuclease/phosphatase family protein [Deltaproteobacteria bacterium]|nr:endonuclease/exonuclease/phosphatase family protein [Deltaproteobacteria bacterium]
MDRDEISVLTLNTWFDGFERERRTSALLDRAGELEPDVIALQEVREDVVRALRDAAWVRRSYEMSDAIGTTMRSYGNLLLTRLPMRRLELHPFPTITGRRLLLAELQVNDGVIAIGVVHLESTKEMAGTRAEQLQRTVKVLSGFPQALIVGDCNFDVGAPEERVVRGFVDTWPALHAEEPGWTVDATRNPMRRRFGSDKRARYDRVFLRSDDRSWTAESASLFADDAVDADAGVFVSDHFGVLTRLRHDAGAHGIAGP